jgi:hypothetical protein
MHPKFGMFTEPREPGVGDIEALRSHPLAGGDFYVAERHGAQGWAVKHTSRADFTLTTAEHADAAYIVQLLALAQAQLAGDDEAAAS